MKKQWFALLAGTLFLGACGGTNGGSQSEGYSGQGEQTSSSRIDFTNLSVAEISPVPFSGSHASIQTDESDASYLLILNAANTVPGSYAVQLGDGSLPSLGESALRIEEEIEDPDDALFHRMLIEEGAAMATSPEYQPVRRSGISALSKAQEVGNHQTFKVLSTMTSLSKYEEIETTLRVATPDLLFYVDADAVDHISDEEIQDLADKFQAVILPINRSLFGTESDINGDARISIVMSCTTNRMSSSSGIVTGFFFPGDLYASSPTNPASNAQEIFYTILPDPDGECSIPISSEFALGNILPGVLAHEYQHMISFNRHVFMGKGKTEEPWLNEALSHLAEDLTGFGLENYSRVKLFLSHPNETSLVPASMPTLSERGAGYAFLRYLYEQSADGEAFMRNLLEGDATGVSNIVASFGGSDSEFDEFREFLQRWSITLAVTDTGMTSDPRYNYRERTIDAQTGNPTGICMRCDAGDGRGSLLEGPKILEVTSYPLTADLRASASEFFLIHEPPDHLMIQATGSPTLTGSMLRLE